MHNQLLLQMLTYYSNNPLRSQHFLKVHALAKLIGIREEVDETTLEILEVSAYVHDIGIKKAEMLYGTCEGKLQEELGPVLAQEMLVELGYAPSLIDRVCFLVGHHHTYHNMEGIDYQILVEADFLVNFFESEMKIEAIRNVYDTIFKTKTGKAICAEMFGL